MPVDLTLAPSVAEIEDAGRTIPLLDVNGDPWLDDDGTPVTATIAGLYSKRYRQAKTKELDRALKTGKRGTGEEFEAANLRVDAALVLTWDIQINGQMAPPAVVFQQLPHIRDQITEAAAEHAAFFAPTSSRP